MDSWTGGKDITTGTFLPNSQVCPHTDNIVSVDNARLNKIKNKQEANNYGFYEYIKRINVRRVLS